MIKLNINYAKFVIYNMKNLYSSADVGTASIQVSSYNFSRITTLSGATIRLNGAKAKQEICALSTKIKSSKKLPIAKSIQPTSGLKA